MTTDQIEATHGTARLPEEGISWRSIRIRRPVEQVQSAWETANIPGSPEFHKAPQDRGTILHVTIPDEPDEGSAHRLEPREGKSIAEELETALREFKSLCEAGEIATITGQSAGRRDD